MGELGVYIVKVIPGGAYTSIFITLGQLNNRLRQNIEIGSPQRYVEGGLLLYYGTFQLDFG
ncbi:hypothetical protein SDC9_100298 [bioreactor metagenome]|uniref:Uncharacterized protein n=1 Tax=bioreactor metagenome TaxID=1076179 RepID=A0A645AK82_9ZZZZ